MPERPLIELTYYETYYFSNAVKPGIGEDPEVGAESGALGMRLVIGRERGVEVMSRGVELAKAQQGAAHRMMRFAAARRIGRAARERLLRYLARALQVAEA